MGDTQSPNYKYERVRLQTFQSWPANAKVEAWKMAKAGLLYTGLEEEVKCTWCGVIISDWQYGDQVMAKHRMTSPDCPFVRNQSDNVPYVPGDSNTPLPPPVPVPEDTDDVGPETPRLGIVRPPFFPPVDQEDDLDRSRSSPEGPTEIDYRSEAARLASFSSWNVPFISPSDLARAGFYSLNQHDSCKCAFCFNCVGDWVEGDDPMTEHSNLFPLCRFVQGLEVGNIPIGSDPVSEELLPPTSPGHDETGLRWTGGHTEPNTTPEKGKGHCSVMGSNPEAIGILKHAGPLHPQYATLEARLRTFREWPPALRQQPKELADAGFYYIGLSDQVKCFYCDGGLRNWQPEDVPWVEHARWFSRCVFVRLVKGDEYVQKCLLERPPEKAGMSFDKPRPVTEEDIRRAMSQAIVRQVLSMGIDHSRVKMAIKKQLEGSGNPFDTAESLISAAFSVQRAQERRTMVENLNPVGALLGRLGETHPRGSGGSDRVTERWEIGQSQEGGAAELPEYMEEQSQEQNNIISLNRTQESTSSGPQSLPPPSPTTSPQHASSSQPASLPSTPSTHKQEESFHSLPLNITANSAEKEKPETDLESENARLKEQRTCKICMDGEVGVVFLPCGHLCCCVNCAPALKDCPVCRTKIQGTVRTFLS